MEEVKGEDIIILDFQQKENAICKYFVLCSGNSNTHAKAISHSVEKSVRKNLREKPFNVEGEGNAEWILMDYISIIVHVFQKQVRDFYEIENLWGDMETVELNSLKRDEIER